MNATTAESTTSLLGRCLGNGRYRLEAVGLRLLGDRFNQVKNVLLGRPATFCELSLLAGFLRQVSPRGTMVDVGAQFGESFVPFANMGWQVLAFEPDPNEKKHAAIAARRTSTVQLERIAISNKVGEVPFFVSPESTGVSTINPFLDSHEQVTMVATDTLERVLAARSIDHVDFLKIDTEGHDLFVLQGLDWDKVVPKAVLCEFDDRKTVPLGYTYADMAQLLTQVGYTVLLSEWYPIEKYGVQHRWRDLRSYPCELSDPQGWGNLIAIDATHADQFLDFLKRRQVALSSHGLDSSLDKTVS